MSYHSVSLLLNTNSKSGTDMTDIILQEVTGKDNLIMFYQFRLLVLCAPRFKAIILRFIGNSYATSNYLCRNERLIQYHCNISELRCD